MVRKFELVRRKELPSYLEPYALDAVEAPEPAKEASSAVINAIGELSSLFPALAALVL